MLIQIAAIAVLASSLLAPVAAPTAPAAAPASSLASAAAPLATAPAFPGAYDAVAPSPRTLYVDPSSGRDGSGRGSRAKPLRTLTAAWNMVPTKASTRGWKILLLPGKYSAAQVPNYMEAKHGSQKAPIWISSASGKDTVTLPALNVFDVSYLYITDVSFSSRTGDAFHCEKCDHILLRGNTIRGAPADSGIIGDLVKFNQSMHVFLEGNDISGASDNALDFVSVQYGHLLGNKIHDSQDWCAYAKGGSAYLDIAYNEFYDCGTGGFTAGQGTGLQFMTAPWLQYEAYDMRIFSNLVRDTEGAAFGVNGGVNILIAFNTALRTGSRDHSLEFVAGSRSCDGAPGDEGRSRCGEYISAGAWGTTVIDDGDNYVRIPNKNVFVYNNLLYNPPGYAPEGTIIVVAGPYSQRQQGAPNPAVFDEGLVFAGNVIWEDRPLGLGQDEYGCSDAHPTCSAAAFLAGNLLNPAQPAFDGNRLTEASLASVASIAKPIPPFPAAGLPAAVPAMRQPSSIAYDYTGSPRTGLAPGAFAR